MHVFSKVFPKSLSNLGQDFWEDCLPIPKLLLAANRLICPNITIGTLKIHGPPCVIIFGVKIRLVLKKYMIFIL